MKRYTAMLSLLSCMVLASACSNFGGGHESDIRVMTRNVYVGGNVDRIIEAQSAEEIPVLVLLTWQEVVANDFNARAQALADEILREQPHLIGLQEITTLRIQNPGDAALGGTEPATEVAYDYLEILLQALEDRNLDYQVAGKIEDTDVEMPMVISQEPLAFQDVRMTDYDVVLVRSDVTVEDVFTKTYDVLLDVPSIGLQIKRGFVSVRAVVDGYAVRFVSTHLEPVTVPELQDLQMAQAQELINGLDDATTIVVGDLNSGPGDATYGLFEAASFRDAWKDAQRENPGLTCCFASDLRPGRPLETRYDLVLFRSGDTTGLTARDASRLGVSVIGPAGGIYPSDHAGVSVSFDAQ